MLTRSMSLRSVLIATSLCGLMLFVMNFFSFHPKTYDIESNDDLQSLIKTEDKSNVRIRTQSDVKSNSKPATLIINDKQNEIPQVSIRSYLISVNHRQEHHIFVRETGESSFVVLLLHGQRFSSKNWEDIGTLQYLASWGYRAIAIDLPGYGNSSLPVIDEQNAGPWLIKLIDTLKISNFVLVSPSMSGRFSIPYVIQSNHHKHNLRGFLPIAPSSTELLTEANAKIFTIPTLIVQGELDSGAKSALESLKMLPKKTILTIPKASHACYMDKPVDFHNGLRQFLYDVFRPIFLEQRNNRPNVHSAVSSPNTKS